MIHISLFSGIGGFDLAASWMGWQNLASCEIADVPQSILLNHHPYAYHHDDIHTLTYQTLDHELKKRFGQNWRSDDVILTGGFPCQPYSTAGKRLGKNDARHLWPEMLRVIKETSPTYIVGENVRGFVNWNGGVVFDEVCASLEDCGYTVFPVLLPACGVGAPHRRDRIWIIAHTTGRGLEQRQGKHRIQSEATRNKGEADTLSEFSKSWLTAHTDRNGLKRSNRNNEINPSQGGVNAQRDIIEGGCNEYACNSQSSRLERGDRVQRSEKFKQGYSQNYWRNFPTQPPICTGNDGFPYESLRQRIREDSMGVISEKEIDEILSRAAAQWRTETIKAAGNAIVPQVAYMIFQAIQQVHNELYSA